MRHVPSVSRKHIGGQLKRAQDRIEKAVRGSSREDIVIQAVLGFVGASLALRLLRLTPISKLVGMIAPVAVVAAIVQHSTAPSGGRASR